jgi:hypothetical protein
MKMAGSNPGHFCLSSSYAGLTRVSITSNNTVVILRCSPFFTASLEGWAASFETPRKRAAPQDDG